MWTKQALLIGVAVTCAPAFADDVDVGHWYVAPKVGYTFADSDRAVDDDLNYGFTLGKHINSNWSMELNVLTGDHEGPAGIDVSLLPISVDLLRVFNRGSHAAPYLSLGAGVLTVDPDGPDSEENFMAQAGLGLMWRLWENSAGTSTFSLRPEVKARWDEAGGGEHPLDYLAGISFVFAGGAEAPAPQPPAPPPPPPPPPEPAPPPEPVPPPPVDTDGDGVYDDKDRCPGTPRGVAVDADGCPLKGSITLTGVNFETDSTALTPDSHTSLGAVAADLSKYPRLKVELQGHTDSVGSDAYNRDLSDRRAQAVREYLISRGVKPEQLTARGYGEEQPVADNGTPEGRAQNRRVAMNVIENPGEVEVTNESDQ